MRRTWSTAAIALAVLIVACTGDASPTTQGVEPVDRLVILDEEGNVATVSPDGSDETIIADRESSSSFFFQPTWSPASDRIAWGQGGFDGFALGIADVDGDAPEAIEMANNPFYIYWSPDGNWVAALHNSEAGAIDLEMVDTTALTTSVVANGAPFYFSWEGSSQRVVAHVEARRFEFIEPDGTVEDLDGTSPAYQAPLWTDAGIIHLADEGLSLLPAEGEQVVIATFSGSATFVGNPDGKRIAVQVLGEGGITAGITAMPALPRGGVVVLDLETEEVETVTSEPALAYFWSPDGQSLLILEPSDQPGLIEAVVWDGTEASPVITYSPHASFVNDLLPFFTQYAQSVRLWSPDSTEFAFAGSVDGTPGIWVQPADGGEPRFVTEGTWVAWSTH